MPKEEPDAPGSHAVAHAAAALRAPVGTQDWEGSWHIPHSHGKRLERSPPLQLHSQPSRHTKARVSTHLQQLSRYCPRISHLITASPSATGRSCFTQNASFIHPTAKPFSCLSHWGQHPLLLCINTHTHKNTCMTIKELVIMQRNPMTLTDCPNTMAQEHKASQRGWLSRLHCNEDTFLSSPECFSALQMPSWNCSHTQETKTKTLKSTVWATSYRQSMPHPRNSDFAITAVLGYQFLNYVVSCVIWKVLSHLKPKELRCVYSTTSCGKFYSL